jgi:hypothetical protein
MLYQAVDRAAALYNKLRKENDLPREGQWIPGDFGSLTAYFHYTRNDALGLPYQNPQCPLKQMDTNARKANALGDGDQTFANEKQVRRYNPNRK